MDLRGWEKFGEGEGTPEQQRAYLEIHELDRALAAGEIDLAAYLVRTDHRSRILGGWVAGSDAATAIARERFGPTAVFGYNPQGAQGKTAAGRRYYVHVDGQSTPVSTLYVEHRELERLEREHGDRVDCEILARMLR